MRNPQQQVDSLVNSAMELLSVRAWPGPERNPRIEDYIMSDPTRKTISKRRLWIGGAAILLGGSAIGAAVTSMVTHSFSGTLVGTDGTNYNVQGQMSIEDQGGGQKQVEVSIDGVPGATPIQSGTLKLDDGRVVQVVPVQDGLQMMVPVDPTDKAPAKPAPAAAPK